MNKQIDPGPNFADPRCFIPPKLLGYLDLSRLPGPAIPARLKAMLPGVLKKDPSHFVVLEPKRLPYAGMSESMLQEPRSFLTIGPDSDYPGLQTDQELQVEWFGRKVYAVSMTVVKTGENTWRMCDSLAEHIGKQLGRHIPHSQILTSGIKDRWAITAQTVVIVGVSMAEMKTVDWSGFAPGRRGFFVKDIQPTNRLLDMGDHLANGFEIKVLVDGASKAELQEYMEPRAFALSMRNYWILNFFHRQRLGPGQNLQMKGLTLLTGEWEPVEKCFPFRSAAEAMVHRLLFEVSHRDNDGVRALRHNLETSWQYNFEELERNLGRQYKRYNLTLEYEVAKRLADEFFNGCCESVLYDLRNRLSLCIGAWQAYYWNQALASQLESGYLAPDVWARNGDNRSFVQASIPLAMSCEESKRVYRRTAQGQKCLEEMAKTEELAARGTQYLRAYIESYWAAEALKPHKQRDRTDNTGLSLKLVRSLFSGADVVNGVERPDASSISAALVMHLFLVPRDRRSGVEKSKPPRRKAFVRANDFDYDVEDGAVNLRFNLRSGAYATTLVGLLFDTTDPEELDNAGN